MLETKPKQPSNDEWMVRLKQLEQETQALSKDQETLIIILTQAQIHYS